jgi:DNA polymerase III subunit epsilon
MYSIIDVETTGFGASGNKITDISVFVYDGEKIVNEFHSLVNPECKISYRITQLTGITDQMVAHAPKFYEIAKQIEEITKDTVFVAHNVNFDYGVIRGEFTSLGYDYKREKLCTVRLSRKLIPGLPSYSLGNLCGAVGITIEGRHRAYGDAKATTELFGKLVVADVDGTIFTDSLNIKSKEATLPPMLSREVFDGLPSKTGVYYFHNQEGKVIYVGKAKDIRQRVLSHFRDKAKKEVEMSSVTANVTYEETGNELVALLKESADIKHIYPQYNRAQKRAGDTYGIFKYEDNQGILHLGFNRLKLVPQSIATFHNQRDARAFLEGLCEEHQLCPKYCHLQTAAERCFHFQIKKCKGVCCKKELPEHYNERVNEALSTLGSTRENMIIEGAGRKKNEKSVVVIKDGTYLGYGFISAQKKITATSNLEKEILQQKDNRDIQSILRRYFREQENLTILE